MRDSVKLFTRWMSDWVKCKVSACTDKFSGSDCLYLQGYCAAMNDVEKELKPFFESFSQYESLGLPHPSKVNCAEWIIPLRWDNMSYSVHTNRDELPAKPPRLYLTRWLDASGQDIWRINQHEFIPPYRINNEKSNR